MAKAPRFDKDNPFVMMALVNVWYGYAVSMRQWRGYIVRCRAGEFPEQKR